MMPKMSLYDIVVLTDERWEQPTDLTPYACNVLAEDHYLIQALSARGLRVARKAWSADFDWSDTACAVFRSTWDYVANLSRFLAWLSATARQTQLINPPSLVRWNLDKHYLVDLAARNLPVVPTCIREAGDKGSLATWIEESGWPEVVLKPAIGASGHHTYRLRLDQASAMEDTFRRLSREQAMVLQPFQADILEGGEVSLIFVRDQFTHAVRKTARAGEFRVQDDHGGQVQAYRPDRREIDLARAVVSACSPIPQYARIDLVRSQQGEHLLMELELIEPELFFRFAPTAADTLAEAIAERVAGDSTNPIP